MAIHRVGNHANTPPVSPYRTWNFAKSKNMPSTIYFDRNSTAKYWDGKTTTEADQNLIKQSSTWSSPWGFSALQYTSGITDAFGGSTALRIQEDNANSWHYLLQYESAGLFVEGAGRYCFSVVAKQNNGNRWILLRPFDTAAKNAYFDINTGNLGTVDSGVEAHMEDLGDGWYRCSMSAVFTSPPKYYQLMMVAGNNSTQYQGDNGTSKVDVCFPSVERDVYKPGTYIPTTTKPIVKRQPKLMTAQSDEPVFEHDPTTGHCFGYRMEGARTNLITQSEARTALNYLSPTSSAFFQTGVYDPEGKAGTVLTLRADTPSSYSVGDIYISGMSINNVYTASVFVKANGAGMGLVRLQMSQNNNGYSAFVDIDLSDADPMSTVSPSVNNGGLSTIISHNVVDCGGGWYRLGVTFTQTTTTSANIYRVALLPDSSRPKASGVSIWGMQVEAGYSMSSYIATSGSTVTRVKDNAEYDSSKHGKLFSEQSGTVLAKFKVDQATNPYPRILSSGSSVNDGIIAIVGTISNGSLGNAYFQMYNPHTQTINSPINAIAKQENYVGWSWDESSWESAINGNNSTSVTPQGTWKNDPNATWGVATAYNNSDRNLDGTLSKIIFFDGKLTGDQIEAITEE